MSLWIKLIGGIGPGVGQLDMCKAGEARPQKWTRLPTRMGGAGLKSWSTFAVYAWDCSFASCIALDDKDFNNGREFLRAECEEAHKRALTI